MKHYNKLLLTLMIGGLSISCADEFKSEYTADKPESIAQYEYLNAYGALKSYVNRTTDPNFKLGSGIIVSDFLNKELVYSLAVANYDELTAGNAMKYASCVDDNGAMNFLQVSKFVEAAKDAGIGIYGHTLLWHAQQNNTYLNGLIAPTVVPSETIEGWVVVSENDFETNDDSNYSVSTGATTGFTAVGQGSDGIGRAFTITNESVRANDYDCQLFFTFSPAMQANEKYMLTMDVRADEPAKYGTQAHLFPTSYLHWDFFGEISATTTWATYKKEIIVSANAATATTIAFNLGKTATTFYFDNIKVEKYVVESTGGPTLEASVITNSDFETGIDGWGGWGNSSTRGRTVEGDGYNGGYAYWMTNPSTANSWDAQVAYNFPSALEEGSTYVLNFMVKGTVAGSISADMQKPDGYAGRGSFGSLSVTTEWKEITTETVITGDNATRFLFNIGAYVGTIYIDNITLCRLNPDGDGSIEKTDEEKKEILTEAMGTWIAGIMEACDGYVKAWDVVNEPMSDSHSTELKSDPGKTDTNNFYWQDYLGKDYARTAVKFARQYGGDDLLLFVNDYNLEATYNNNAKCEGLIQMVAYWESDGVTKIDGIGTQMHVSYSMDPDKQQKKEACIVKMYELLAASGKLIKVTELDMGIVDASDNSILTANTTAEQHQLMADFYTFIVSKYFEIIPAAQRYGIAHWSPTDSPTNSGWRKGEPIGLWDLNYNRKPAYAGFADGLNK